MRQIFLFMNVSLDGYFEAPGHDISGFTGDFEAFSADSSNAVDALLFGHRTYEMMKFWSTPQAQEMQREVARFMTATPKYVVSHADFDPGWENVTVFSGDVIAKVKALKEADGKSIMIMGSNMLCVSLIPHALIDEFQIVVNPVLFGDGSSLFAGLTELTKLALTETRQFKSGATLLTYSR